MKLLQITNYNGAGYQKISVEVSDEVYAEYMRPIWREKKRLSRQEKYNESHGIFEFSLDAEYENTDGNTELGHDFIVHNTYNLEDEIVRTEMFEFVFSRLKELAGDRYELLLCNIIEKRALTTFVSDKKEYRRLREWKKAVLKQICEELIEKGYKK